MRDSEIEQWVLSEIKNKTHGRLKELCVFSLNGVVKLNGTAHSRADKLAAQAAVERARGVVAVINELNVQRKRVTERGVAVVLVPDGFHRTPKPLTSSHVAS